MTDQEFAKKFEEKGNRLKKQLNEEYPMGFLGFFAAKKTPDSETFASCAMCTASIQTLRTMVSAAMDEDPMLERVISELMMERAMKRMADVMKKLNTEIEKADLQKKYGSKMGEA